MGCQSATKALVTGSKLRIQAGLGSSNVAGSKRELRPGVWELRVSLGRDGATGKYKQLSRTYHGDAEGADEALRALVAAERPKPSANLPNGTAEPAIGHLSADGDQVAVAEEAPADGPDGLRRLIAALPLEAGEFVVGWSADRPDSAVAVAEAEYGDPGAAVYRLVQLHRLRRYRAVAGSGEPAPRTVWVRRELVEQAQPALGHDCAIHVWTV